MEGSGYEVVGLVLKVAVLEILAMVFVVISIEGVLLPVTELMVVIALEIVEEEAVVVLMVVVVTILVVMVVVVVVLVGVLVPALVMVETVVEGVT